MFKPTGKSCITSQIYLLRFQIIWIINNPNCLDSTFQSQLALDGPILPEITGHAVKTLTNVKVLFIREVNGPMTKPRPEERVSWVLGPGTIRLRAM